MCSTVSPIVTMMALLSCKIHNFDEININTCRRTLYVLMIIIIKL